MATITEKNIDISEHFGKLAGTVIYTHLIKEKGLPRTALIVDHKEQGMYFYEHNEGEISIALTPIQDEATLNRLKEIVTDEIMGDQEQ